MVVHLVSIIKVTTGEMGMMGLGIGKILLEKREEKGITQDVLANFIGVSKASISKWETGKTYPDITLLPKLAAFYNMTVDELIGYTPQLTKEEIKKQYHELATQFSKQDFQLVYEHSQSISQKYYACLPLLLQLGILYLNHYMLAPTEEKQQVVLAETAQLFARIKQESDDVWLNKQANSLQAVVYLLLKEPEKILALLGDTLQPAVGDEMVLSNAFQMMGDIEQAKRTLQVNMYQSLLNMVGTAHSYILLTVDKVEEFEETIHRMEGVTSLFGLKELHPTIVLQFYYAAAQGYAMQENREKTLYWLEQYVAVCTSVIFPITLHGDDFFTLIDAWLEDLDLGIKAVRDDEMIKESMLQSVCAQPAFTFVQDDPFFKVLIENLKFSLGGNK